MALAVVGEMTGGNAQMDESMMREIGVSEDAPPRGAIARFAGPTTNGWRVISVWESNEAWETFRRERMEPAFQRAGREMPSMEMWDLQQVIIPATQHVRG